MASQALLDREAPLKLSSINLASLPTNTRIVFETPKSEYQVQIINSNNRGLVAFRSTSLKWGDLSPYAALCCSESTEKRSPNGEGNQINKGERLRFRVYGDRRVLISAPVTGIRFVSEFPRQSEFADAVRRYNIMVLAWQITQYFPDLDESVQWELLAALNGFPEIARSELLIFFMWAYRRERIRDLLAYLLNQYQEYWGMLHPDDLGRPLTEKGQRLFDNLKIYTTGLTS